MTREPVGSPAGGQFAEQGKREPAVTIGGPGPWVDDRDEREVLDGLDCAIRWNGFQLDGSMDLRTILDRIRTGAAEYDQPAYCSDWKRDVIDPVMHDATWFEAGLSNESPYFESERRRDLQRDVARAVRPDQG